MVYGSFFIKDLFEKLNLKCLKKNFTKEKDISKQRNAEFNLPLINAKHGDNGIMYFGRENEWEHASMCIDVVNDGAVSTGDVYPQIQETGVLYNAYLIKPKFENVTKNILIYLSVSIEKAIKYKYSYDNKATWDRIKVEKVDLPIKKGKVMDYSIDDIDFKYMDMYIEKMQSNKIEKIEKTVNEELDELSNCQTINSNVIYKPYRLGNIFSKLKAPYIGKQKNKKDDVSCIRTKEYNVPVVYAKRGDNGIMYWAKHNTFTTYSNVISIIYNGAVAAGLAYAHEQETGILAESYFIKLNSDNVSFRSNLYIKTVIEKKIYDKYSRDNLATWDGKVENEIIYLPIKKEKENHVYDINDIDFEYMDKYISYIEYKSLKKITL